ncbi:MAG: DUF5053 domain-containing protein [Bacteroidales bacterium]|nr:DUF5053 domain-containing protein [Bacteroidales bacterium]
MEYYGKKVADVERYKESRKGAILYKDLALMLQFEELDKIINVSKFSKRFMHKSQSWFAQRTSGMTINGEKVKFKPDEYARIAESFRELARQLNQYADEIDAAE